MRYLPFLRFAHTHGIPEGQEAAGFPARFVAFLLDVIIFSGVFALALSLWNFLGAEELTGRSVLVFNVRQLLGGGITAIQVFLLWVYFAGMESSPKQATIGKLLLNITVADIHGNRISFLRATVRHFSKALSAATLFIGYAMPLWTEKKQALHDVIAQTVILSPVKKKRTV